MIKILQKRLFREESDSREKEDLSDRDLGIRLMARLNLQLEDARREIRYRNYRNRVRKESGTCRTE